MKKLYKINQFTAAEWDGIEYDWNEHEDEIVIIEKKDAYCMDITANGKRIVPILRKIEEAMTAAGLAGETGIYAGWFGEWANELTDRRDRKYFIWNYSGQSDRERGCWSYSWGIEQIDEDRWYIFLNIAKPQQETEETETETAAPSAPSANEETTAHTEEQTTDTEEKEEDETMTTANELQKYVNSIAADLRTLYEAEPTDEEREAAEENGEAYDLYSYFADALDIEYTISSRGDFLGARIAVALGGPNIYVDTREGYVKGYWGTDRAEAWIPSEICEEINSIMEEYYDMVRGA